MHLLLISLFCAWSANFVATQEKGEEALRQGSVKKAETLYHDFLKTADFEEKGAAKSQLAIVYFKDQEQEKAFRIFLEALETAKNSENFPSEEERKVYEQALKIYLEHIGSSPEETALKIRAQFGSVMEKNPHYYLLGFLLAVGEANLGNYDRFFSQFFDSYTHYPQHFLVYKTKAGLHIKLFDRAKSDEEREEQRRLILKNAKEAVAIQPNDSSLYRMIVGFTDESSKCNVLTTYLNKIVDQNIVVSRIDIPYYVEIAIAFEQYDLAQKFLDKAKQWYKYSRVINVAQEYLDEQRSQK